MSSGALLPGIGTGLCGGLLSGLFGVGGGIVMVPLLGLFLGLDQHRAQGATLAAMLLPTGFPAVVQYRRRGVPSHLRLVGMLILGFLFGGYAGALAANRIPATALRWGYAGLLILLAGWALARPEPVSQARERSAAEVAKLGIWGFPIGLLAGLVSGLTGLGGAVVVVPLLAVRFRMTQHEAQLASLMMLLPPIGGPAVYVYARAQGGLPWMAIGGVALGFAAGALAGARLATGLPGAWLRRAFAALLLALALAVLGRAG